MKICPSCFLQAEIENRYCPECQTQMVDEDMDPKAFHRAKMGMHLIYDHDRIDQAQIAAFGYENVISR